MLREDAKTIWWAGVHAVAGDRCIQERVTRDGNVLTVGETKVELRGKGRLCVVGAGKAAGQMAMGLVDALGRDWLHEHLGFSRVQVPEPWVDDASPLKVVAARPAGKNEPTQQVVAGTISILQAVAELNEDDVCIALLSGGGSALLAAPVEGVTLEDKLAVTHALVDAGADIRELNAVRSRLSRVKGGGLARACASGQLVTILLSDVLGDPLWAIASGPTILEAADHQSPEEIAQRRISDDPRISGTVWKYLQSKPDASSKPTATGLTTEIVGNLSIALEASAEKAAELGYEVRRAPIEVQQPDADTAGKSFARDLIELARSQRPICLLSGGEPTVHLAPGARRGKGGRNQQLVLRALEEMITTSEKTAHNQQWALLSGGTDGEDGPTDAAGAIIDTDLLRSVAASQLSLQRFLDRNDAWSVLGPMGALLRTGLTGTNVCDLRVLLTHPHR